MLLAMTITTLLAAASAEPAPAALFVGAVGRDERQRGLTVRVEDALRRAFKKGGVETLGAAPAKGDATTARPEDLARLLADARGRFFDGDFKGAVAQCDDGIARFESSFAYRREDEAWRTYLDLMVVRVLALRRLGRDDAGDRGLAALAAQRPAFVPDPGLAPPKVIERHKELLTKLQERKRPPLTVESRPAGATVLVDGVEVGVTPLVLSDVLPGPHYVAVVRGEERSESYVVLKDAARTIEATFVAPRREAAESLLTTLGRGTSEGDLGAKASPLAPTVLACVVETKPGTVTLLVGRIEGERVVGVTVLETSDDLRTLDDDAALLADAALFTEGEQLADGRPASAARARFLGGPTVATASPTATVADEDEGSGSIGLVAGGVAAAGVGVVVVVAGVVGAVLVFLLRPPNPGGTDVVIDASRL